MIALDLRAIHLQLKNIHLIRISITTTTITITLLSISHLSLFTGQDNNRKGHHRMIIWVILSNISNSSSRNFSLHLAFNKCHNIKDIIHILTIKVIMAIKLVNRHKTKILIVNLMVLTLTIPRCHTI